MGWGGDRRAAAASITSSRAGELKGKHAAIDCATCHKIDQQGQGLRTYIGTDRTCGSCHARISRTARFARRSCAASAATPNRCGSRRRRSSTSITTTRRRPRCRSQGTHADVACAKCHPKAAFKLPDVHGRAARSATRARTTDTLFATKKCQLCHSPALKSLSEVRFDHKKEADYALSASTRQIACASCHTKALGKAKPNDSCENCHAKDNKHGTRFAKFPACTTCHSQRAWKTGFQFNHSANTDFELTGKHAKAACRDCHRGKTPVGLRAVRHQERLHELPPPPEGARRRSTRTTSA